MVERARKGFYETITEAVRYFATHGFTSSERLEYWITEIRQAAERSMVPTYVLERQLRTTFGTVYRRMVDQGGLLKKHKGIDRFTIQQVAPRLRAELDRRLMASAQLIKLNRVEAVEKTIRRFAGWASSVPEGGSDNVGKADVKDDVRKALAQLPFVERRVAIDQGHKFASSLNEIVAAGGGAIAVKWNSHFRQANYDYREDHKERDGQVYLLRNNWAQQRGLVKPGPAGYYDAVTAFGEEISCRCFGTYLYNLRDLPDDMVTAKGREELERVRIVR